jgi:hypothetical protein
MLLTNDNNTALSSLFGTQKTNLSAMKNLSGIDEKDPTDNNSLENTRFVMSNENNLSAIERAKKKYHRTGPK